jgi:hypothetical protein
VCCADDSHMVRTEHGRVSSRMSLSAQAFETNASKVS